MADARITALRQAARIKARRRQKKEGGSYSAALFRVRKSDVLIMLSRVRDRYVTHKQIAAVTGVPLRAVRNICKHLERTGHELMNNAKGDEDVENRSDDARMET